MWKSNEIPKTSVEESRAYELQRDVFFAIMGFKINEKIPKTSVEELWRYVGTFENMRELV